MDKPKPHQVELLKELIRCIPGSMLNNDVIKALPTDMRMIFLESVRLECNKLLRVELPPEIREAVNTGRLEQAQKHLDMAMALIELSAKR